MIEYDPFGRPETICTPTAALYGPSFYKGCDGFVSGGFGGEYPKYGEHQLTHRNLAFIDHIVPKWPSSRERPNL